MYVYLAPKFDSKKVGHGSHRIAQSWKTSPFLMIALVCIGIVWLCLVFVDVGRDVRHQIPLLASVGYAICSIKTIATHAGLSLTNLRNGIAECLVAPLQEWFVHGISSQAGVIFCSINEAIKDRWGHPCVGRCVAWVVPCWSQMVAGTPRDDQEVLGIRGSDGRQLLRSPEQVSACVAFSFQQWSPLLMDWCQLYSAVETAVTTFFGKGDFCTGAEPGTCTLGTSTFMSHIFRSCFHLSLSLFSYDYYMVFCSETGPTLRKQELRGRLKIVMSKHRVRGSTLFLSHVQNAFLYRTTKLWALFRIEIWGEEARVTNSQSFWGVERSRAWALQNTGASNADVSSDLS